MGEEEVPSTWQDSPGECELSYTWGHRPVLGLSTAPQALQTGTVFNLGLGQFRVGSGRGVVTDVGH